MPDLAGKIRNALSEKKPDLLADARQLLNALEYESERTMDETHPPADFLRQYDPKNGEGVNARELKKQAGKIGVVFQVTDEEIRQTSGLYASEFQPGDERSFIFVAVDLKGDHYPRWRLARMTRAVNRCFASPAVVLFRHPDAAAADAVSLAFIHRRQSKTDSAKDVLGRVSVLRAVNRDSPHRGHLDILQDLALSARLEWMTRESKTPANFDGLLAAWLAALDVEELNRRFYRELQEWFDRAVRACKFPDGNSKEKKQAQVMRMITRLLFIWFVKEKGLAPGDLFMESFASASLKNHASENSDYYRAVLQNLFFGTLNTPREERGFRKRNQPGPGERFYDDQHGVSSIYRYADLLEDQSAFEDAVDSIPFVNGGLFDCLDDLVRGRKKAPRADSRNPRNRVDCFTDYRKDRSLLHVPSRLFFDEKEGLFPLFDRYKFTVAENTPVNQEVALDPELLGLVFENLLAAVIPESSKNARRATGSYYTPREIVEYMVDEALVAHLAGRLGRKFEPRLRKLVSWEDPDKALFSQKENKAIIDAIDELRILDPAVGSGAFPMGMLHKLVHILSRVDKHNKEWKKKQLDSLKNMPDSPSRREAKRAIERVFAPENNYDDYGRKLFLIQHAIHGADLQPMATQIARLRFFISLVIDQKPHDKKDNCGIDPLPNLETKFVTADSLVRIMGRREQLSLAEDRQVQDLQDNLNLIRRDYFSEKTRSKKIRLQSKDEQLRGKLEKVLERSGFASASAQRIASWNPYDQTAGADWFDAELMMGVRNGFDIVIGNPPYLESRNPAFHRERKNAYQKQVEMDWSGENEPIPRGSDLLVYFFPRAIRELNPAGAGIFIVQNSWLHADYGKKFQQFATRNFSISRIVDSAFRHFVGANAPSVNTIITSFSPRRDLPLHMRSMQNWEDVAGNEKIFNAEELRNNQWKWGVLFESPPWLLEILNSLRARENDNRGVRVHWGQGINEPQHFYMTARDAASRFDVGADKLHPVFFKGALFDFSRPEFFLLSAEKFEKEEIKGLRKKDAPIFHAGDARHIPDLILPRGVGKHYCALNPAQGYSYSGVECRLAPKWRKRATYSVWALMNSSLIWLYREISGRKNLGGGMLKAEATDMRQLGDWLRIPDMEKEARNIFNSLCQREPLPVLKEIGTPEHRAIDKLVCRALGCEAHEEKIRDALQEAVKFRGRKAQTVS